MLKINNATSMFSTGRGQKIKADTFVQAGCIYSSMIHTSTSGSSPPLFSSSSLRALFHHALIFLFSLFYQLNLFVRLVLQSQKFDYVVAETIFPEGWDSFQLCS